MESTTILEFTSGWLGGYFQFIFEFFITNLHLWVAMYSKSQILSAFVLNTLKCTEGKFLYVIEVCTLYTL